MSDSLGLYDLVSSPLWEKELRVAAGNGPYVIVSSRASIEQDGSLKLFARIKPDWADRPKKAKLRTHDWQFTPFCQLAPYIQWWVMRLIGERAMVGEPNIQGARWWEGTLFGHDGVPANGLLDKELLIFRYVDLQEAYFAQRLPDEPYMVSQETPRLPWLHNPARARFDLMASEKFESSAKKRQ